MQTVLYHSVILLAFLACANAFADPFGLERPTGGYPDVHRDKQRVIVSVWNPQQIATLAEDVESYGDATSLNFEATGATDAEFARLPILPAVQAVRIRGETGLTDKSLCVLARLPALTGLTIDAPGITGEGFRYFVRSQEQEAGARLEDLTLGSTSISREALVNIGRINSLTSLMLRSTSCIDPNATVETLSGHPTLTLVVISLPKEHEWEPNDRVRLQGAMPKTNVWFGVFVRGDP
jgi:hypothetical protein